MSHKIRLNRLEKIGADDRLWALIGIGKPKDAQHQRMLEVQARQHFYASEGNREAYLAFLPLIRFLMASSVMSRKASSSKRLQTRQKTLLKINGTPGDGTSTLEKRRGYAP